MTVLSRVLCAFAAVLCTLPLVAFAEMNFWAMAVLIIGQLLAIGAMI